MRVAMYYSNRDVRLEEMDTPVPGPGELLLKIMASGLCGSDVMEWYRRHKVPLVLGHEVAGVVEAVGDGVESFAPGDRVAVSHHVPCNTCHYCGHGSPTACETLRTTSFDPGGFAEFVRVPAINVDRGVYRLPEGVSFEEGTFAEPLACVLRGWRKLKLGTGGSLAVIGSGISGLLHIALARTLGAGVISAADIDPHRLAAARRFGADHTVDARENLEEGLRRAFNGQAPDGIILTTGAVPAVTAALRLVNRGGTILFFAPTDEGVTVPLSINEVFWRTEVTLTTSYAGAPADHVAALELIRAGTVPVADMITHRFGLADAQKGFDLVVAGGEAVKIILEPQN